MSTARRTQTQQQGQFLQTIKKRVNAEDPHTGEMLRKHFQTHGIEKKLFQQLLLLIDKAEPKTQVQLIEDVLANPKISYALTRSPELVQEIQKRIKQVKHHEVFTSFSVERIFSDAPAGYLIFRGAFDDQSDSLKEPYPPKERNAFRRFIEQKLKVFQNDLQTLREEYAAISESRKTSDLSDSASTEMSMQTLQSCIEKRQKVISSLIAAKQRARESTFGMHGKQRISRMRLFNTPNTKLSIAEKKKQ